MFERLRPGLIITANLFRSESNLQDCLTRYDPGILAKEIADGIQPVCMDEKTLLTMRLPWLSILIFAVKIPMNIN